MADKDFYFEMERSTVTTVEENSFLHDLRDIKIQLRNFACECGLRNLVESEKWQVLIFFKTKTVDGLFSHTPLTGLNID